MGNYPAGNVAINVKDFLDNPSRVERVVRDLTKDKTIADYAFGQGDAKNGAVVYSEILGGPADPDRDVQVIAPGANFPSISESEEEEKMAKVAKYGGESWLTFEAIRRNDVDLLNKRLQNVKNRIIHAVNAVCVNALSQNDNVNKLVLTTAWSVASTDPVADLFAGKALIDDAELGYEGNLFIANPLDVQQYLLGRKDVREQLPKENPALNPVLAADLGNLAGGEWIKSSTVKRGELWVVEKGVSGSVRDEEGGTKTNVYETPANQRKYIQGWRSVVPIITDPKSVTKITGFRA